MIPPAVRAAFALRGDGEVIPGGVSGVVRFGDVVVKPVTDDAEAAWEQTTFSELAMPADVRWARPVAATDGRFVVDGWIADEFVPDLTPVAPDWAAVIEFGHRFHRATRDLPIPTAMLDARQHRWARGERHAFDEEPIALDRGLAALDDDLAARGESASLPAQVVDVDLTTNVFMGRDGVPVVLDLAPAGRAPSYPAAVVVADALVWHAGDVALVERVDPDPGCARALVARALRFRLVTDHLAATESGTSAVDPGRYRAVLARMS